MKEEVDPIPLKLSSEDIAMLKKEGHKAYERCMSLSTNKEFKNAAASIAHADAQGNEFRAEHILLRDIVKVFNDFSNLQVAPENIPLKAKFILIYLYEKLQGRDLSEIYDLPKINALPLAGQFDKNIRIITGLSFFQSTAEIEKEFLLPAILVKIKSEQFPAIASFIYRMAFLMVKSDGKITAKEKKWLKQVADKANHPKILIEKAKYNEVPENDSLEIVLRELHELIGLEDIKKSVEELTNFLKVQKIRKEKGLKATNTSLHAVFMGPPGTGKTTVPRMLGHIYKHLGYLKKGHLVETDRAGMVAGYMGQTALKTDEIIKTALDGVLFIDEAYSLTTGGFNDYGNEAIEILLKRMEDHRGNLVIAVAGYPDEMETFIQSNPGLQSRFNRYFKFDHFGVEALMRIFKLQAQKADFELTEDAEAKVMEILERIHEKRHRGFGNARTMRNLFEKIIEQRANRIVAITPVTEELLKTITEGDIPDILETVKEINIFDESESKITSSRMVN